MEQQKESTGRLGWALELARRGFLIFPLQPDSKKPHEGESWTSIMTADESMICRWFDERPGMNYAVCPGERHVVLDLDRKAKADGVEAFGLLELEHGEVRTFTVETPSGGRHLYLSVDTPASNAHRFPQGIDVRGAHGYVVGPGCEINGRRYEVITDMPPAKAPPWVVERLKPKAEGDERDRAPLFELDTTAAVSRAREFLRHRDPAIEGLGGDHHTLATAMCLIDFGLSEDKVLDLLTEPFKLDDETEERSWNDRCVPPWDVHGRKGTLEEKVKNAWRYRERPAGAKGGGVAFDEADFAEAGDSDEVDRFARLRNHTFSGVRIFSRGRRREFIIPEWLPAHGMTANLAKRGGGKTVVMVDMALRLASDMDWHGLPTKRGYHAVYIAGEDDEGAEEQVRGWCRMHDVDSPPARFVFLDIITDLMSAEDTREWAEYLRAVIGQNGRAAIFLDTWQRGSSRGGQNSDEDMQTAVHHAEALARSLNGPAVVAFHPPKHNEEMVMGSSVIENSTTAIWKMTDHAAGKKLEVTRIKGKGTGNYQVFTFEEVGLGEQDDFGNERTAVVPTKLGGVENSEEADRTEHQVFGEAAFEVARREREKDPDERRYPLSLEAMANELAGTTRGNFKFPGVRKTKDELTRVLANRPYRVSPSAAQSERGPDGVVLMLRRKPNSRGWEFVYEAENNTGVSIFGNQAGFSEAAE